MFISRHFMVIVWVARIRNEFGDEIIIRRYHELKNLFLCFLIKLCCLICPRISLNMFLCWYSSARMFCEVLLLYEHCNSRINSWAFKRFINELATRFQYVGLIIYMRVVKTVDRTMILNIQSEAKTLKTCNKTQLWYNNGNYTESYTFVFKESWLLIMIVNHN